jgi:hypothetical protein
MREQQQHGINAAVLPQHRLLTSAPLLIQASGLRRVAVHRHKCSCRRDAVEAVFGSHIAGAGAPASHRSLVRAQRQQPLPISGPAQVADCSIVRCELKNEPRAAARTPASRFGAAQNCVSLEHQYNPIVAATRKKAAARRCGELCCKPWV